MAKRKKKHRLPYWIRNQEFRILNKSQKDFLGYLYCFGPDTCWLWNWRLAKKFHVTKRTVQRWLKALRENGFVWIEKPFGPQRMIHTRVIPSPEHWVKLIGALALNQKTYKHKRRRQHPRGRIRPIHEYSSETTIGEARRSIIAELVHRGESIEIAEKVADQVIAKSRQKKGS